MATFNADNAAIACYGRVGPDNGAGYRTFGWLDSEMVFVVNGTNCTLLVQGTDTDSFEISVDGGAFSTPTLVANTPSPIAALVAASAGEHLIVLKLRSNKTGYAVISNFITLTGGTASIRAPGANDGGGYGPVALLGSGSNYVDPGSWIEMTIGYASPHNYYNDSVGGFPDCALRVHGRGGKLRFWVYQDEAQFIWSIDGVKQGLFTVPAGNRFGWYTIATGLDEGADHVYEVQTGGDTQTAFQVAYVDAVMFSGSAPAYGSALAARDGLGAIGNSITAAVTGPTDSSLGWVNLLARSLGRTPYNRGKGGNAVEDMMVRTAGITDISPELPECIVLAGTNNLTAAGNGSTPDATFGANYQTLLTNLLTGTADTIFYVPGILPRSGFTAATLLAWNGSGNGVQGSIAAVQAANPADAARLIYVDPVPFALNVGGADYTTNYADGLHLNDAGNVVLAAGLEALLAPATPSSGPATLGNGFRLGLGLGL